LSYLNVSNLVILSCISVEKRPKKAKNSPAEESNKNYKTREVKDNSLLRESQFIIQDELNRKRIMDRLKEKFKRALKNGIDIRHKKIESLQRSIRKYEESKERIKQLNEAQLNKQLELRKKQAEDMEIKEERRLQIEEETRERYKRLHFDHLEKMQSIRYSRIKEDELNERKQRNLLSKIQKYSSLQRRPEEVHEKLLRERNQKTFKKIEEMRTLQKNEEMEERRRYRDLQNLTLNTIVKNKSENYKARRQRYLSKQLNNSSSKSSPNTTNE